MKETNPDPNLYAVQRGGHEILNASAIENRTADRQRQLPPSAAFATH